MVDGSRGVIVVELPAKDFEKIYEGEEREASRMLSVPIELRKSKAPVKLLQAPEMR